MAWARAKLRGKLVYARVDEDGRWAADGGRVEIRYKPSDGRLYRAAARNLEVVDGAVLPDDTCAPAEEVTRARRAPANRPAGAPTRAADEAMTASTSTVAYTDGACSGNPGPAGLGVVVIDPGRCVERSEYLGHSTNNVAELTAVLRALEEIAADGEAVIYTDSRYAIGVLQQGWKARANQALVARVRDALQCHRRVRLVHVKGHAGIPLNERADELARAAIDRRGDERTERGPSESDA